MTRRGAAGVVLLVFSAVAALHASAKAQTHLHYECAGGTEFDLTLLPDDKAAFVQLDGKSLRLPKFVSVTGTRYRGNGVTVWIKGERVTLRRAGKRVECKVR
jgi:membrane-bound inhibitor of C-type lysozyme